MSRNRARGLGLGPEKAIRTLLYFLFWPEPQAPSPEPLIP